jgi:hypothetical protein
MSVFKRIGAIVPGPSLTFAGKWINLFSATRLANPEWQPDADKIALGVGAVLTVYVALAWADLPKDTLRRRFAIGIVASVIGFVACWAIWFYLGPPTPGQKAPDPMPWQDIWYGVYILALAILAPSISVGALSIEEESWKRFWIIVGVCVLIAAAIIAFWLWRR